MKTLVNKNNPQIRITAPEIEISKLFDGSKVYWIPSIHELCGSFSQDHWTLVEGEQPEEICSKCFYYNGYCYNPYGGMRRRINENGVYECTGFCEKEQEQPKRKQSPALKKIMDNMIEEKLAKTRAEMKTVEEEPKKLTWKEVQRLYLIWREVSNELDACSKNFPKWSSSTRDMFGEILKRFYEGDDDQK